MTRYIVLRILPPEETVEWHALVSARSPDAAIRQTAEESGTYVAVPARSWKPQVVEVEQVARVTVKAVDA